MPVIPVTWEAETGGSWLKISWAKLVQDCSGDQTKTKGQGVLVQVVEHLPSTRPSLIPSTAKEKY
jgi:hypothetical protein